MAFGRIITGITFHINKLRCDKMVLRNMLLCMIALLCLVVQAYSQPVSGSPSTVSSDPAISEMLQSLDRYSGTDQSAKGAPPASSPLSGNRTFKNGFPDYPAIANDFLNGAAASDYYTVTVPEFINRTKIDTNWVIVDIRPASMYAEGHIQNAINAPVNNLVSMMGSTIPAGKRIAVYGATNTDAAYAVMALDLFGNRDAYVLLDGISAWQQAAMPVVS